MGRRFCLSALAAALEIVACSSGSGPSSSSNGLSSSSTGNGTTAASSTNGATGTDGTGRVTSASGVGASSGGGSGSSTGGLPDAGVFSFVGNAALTTVQSMSVDIDAGTLWAVTDGPLPDGGYDNGVYVLNESTLATIAAISLPPNITVDGTTYSPFLPGYIIALPGLGKVYFGVATGPGFVEAIDETTHALTTVAQLQTMGDMIAAFAYDPVRRLVYVAVNSRYQSGDTSYPSPGYVYVIDATLDQLLATLSPFDLASLGTSACSLGSNTSCFETQGDLAVDLTGQALYFLGYDQNGAPMAATMVLNGIDAGTLQNVLGGQAGGWLATANGIVTFDDGGAMAGVWLTDGGGGVEVLDPTLDSEALLPTALANVSANCDVDPSLSVQAFMLGGVAGITLFSGPSPIAFVAGLENYNQYCPNAPISALRAAFAKIAATEEVCLEVVFECQPDTGPAVTGLIYTSYCCPDE